MPEKRLTHLDVTHGHDGPYLGIHIKNSVGRAGAVHHDVRRDGVERHDRQMTPAHGASDEQGHDMELSLLTSTGSAGPA